ncbi:DUF7286 family protein [Methanolobus psychrotolerans]|uniref:DUF7286 family protein n=1 Tax=Methanolobus psychrotolerans TaxID=1874706 RepID=UPI000B9199F7|nr:hypothetical protein [Methanolobus psychrotolerans]
MKSDPANKKCCFSQDTRAYIPFAVIGMLMLLFAVMASVYIAKTDYELAEIIYTTDTNDIEKTAVELASADLARCLNYAGMEALVWHGEHPVIKPENLAYESMESDGFTVAPDCRNAEPGDTLWVSVNLPSNALNKIAYSIIGKQRTLIVKSNSGTVYQTIDYTFASSFWTSSSFEEQIVIPANAEYGYTYLIMECDNETKAVNWFHVGSSPLKDITAEYFNEYLRTNYQANQHTFNNYAINVEPDVAPSQIRIDKINGTLNREISRSTSDDPGYPIYYTMTVEDLNCTLVDLTKNTSINYSMDVTALITSREPLLEELVNEYERELNGGVTSDIVLGTTNIRTFTYGPWQHYLNGPLNIVTGPSLSASVNAGALYAQKRVFDSVDPWALTYTTYYNGKVLYSDVKSDTSNYEGYKENNLSATYDQLSEAGSFNISVSSGINESMKDANTTIEEVANTSKIVVSVSNFTNEVYSNWVYNDEKWDEYQPDLIHKVSHEVYSANIQGQVFRDGFNVATPYDLKVGPTSYGSATYQGGTSKTGKDVKWTAHYPVTISHTCALTPDYNFSGMLDVAHKVNIDASSHKWYYKSVRVDHVSTDIVCEGVDTTYEYLGNDTVHNIERTDGYLLNEDHSFNWKVTYNIKFRIKTRWDIYYTYHWSYKTFSPTGWNHYSGDSSGSRTNYPLTDYEKVSHARTETENLSIVYHQFLPSGGYTGISSYDAGSSNDYKTTTVTVNGIAENDNDCSDAADKYREQEFLPKLRIIQGNYLVYTNGTLLPVEKVYCDVPEWLHSEMTREMGDMFDAINTNNPAREVSLLGENLGKNPTTLIQEASLDLAAEMAETTKRESFIGQTQYMNGDQFNTSSDASRAIAKNEAYNYLLKELRERNKNVEGSFEDYIDDSFTREQGHSILDLVKNKISTDVLFNNPAMDKASTALAAEMGIIETMKVEGLPGSKYNWTENITLVVDQYPDYLYHDPEFDLQSQYKWVDEANGKEVYPLAVRNVCVFSTGIGDDIARMLAAASEPLKDVISQSMSQSISDMNAEVDSLMADIQIQSTELAMGGMSADTTLIEQNRTRLMSEYGSSIRQQVPDMVADEVAKDPVLGIWISSSEVILITETYLYTLSDEELVNMVADNTLQEEILVLISDKIRNDNPSVASNEMDAVLYRLEADLRIAVVDGVCEAVKMCQESIDECFVNINTELQKKLDESSEKLTGQLAEKMEKRLQKSMKLVPCGLPVIPPHWVCTVNVWEYDVKGEYKSFEIIDNDNECMFNPYFGHDAQTYIRTDDRIVHPTEKDQEGGYIYIGDNQPIEFRFSGYAATIVGPGPKGVGDKIGERDEKSVAYDNFESQY